MRNELWPEILNDYIQLNLVKEYKYGKHDCVMFMAGFINMITGKDVLKGKRYNGQKSALTLLEKHGGLFNLVDMQFEKVGFKKISNVRKTKRGDVVGFITESHGETVGICIGSTFVSPGVHDLVFLPMTQAVRAWEVK